MQTVETGCRELASFFLMSVRGGEVTVDPE